MNDHKLYRRFWFEFEINSAFNVLFGIGYGCGETAIDLDDAIAMMNRKIFTEIKMPPIKRIVENENIRTLDHGHIISGLKPPIYRETWFPMGYDHSFN